MKKILVSSWPCYCLARWCLRRSGDEGTGAAGVCAPLRRAPSAHPGASITPTDFPQKCFGLAKSGGAQEEVQDRLLQWRHGRVWRRTFWEDMEDFAKAVQGLRHRVHRGQCQQHTTKQLQDSTSLIARSRTSSSCPQRDRPLNVLVEMCAKAGIPLMTVDRGLDEKPGQGAYIATIQIDGYRSGIANGAALVQALTKKYGSAKGNVAEIPGILGSSPAITLSQGIRRVLRGYPDIKMVTVRPGEYDRQRASRRRRTS
jgi:hypothetical protein